MPTREVSEDASVFRGALLPFPCLPFCTVIRRAFCIVPVQASGIFGQVPLSPAPVIPSCVYHAARAGALIHLQLRTRLSSALELSRSRLLTHPLATQSIYLSLIFTSSLSLLLSTQSIYLSLIFTSSLSPLLSTQSIYLSLIFTSSLSLPFSTHAHA